MAKVKELHVHGSAHAVDADGDRSLLSVWVPKTSSAGRSNTTWAGCDVQERAYATRV